MKKLIALALIALAGTAQAHGRDVAVGVVLGAVIAQTAPRVYVPQYPVMVIPPQQPVYAPNPYYQQVYPVPRVITSSEPCHYIGQMVMTFDQYGQPVGYRNCQ